ncbi:hypothetical protein DFA_07147 [Cavenderia fasciculata]|uniref:Uncharacterized protein n=1 Tax=Cavenderia fasciculata TaxID=261658 RepID=F4PVL7_CACFS|nr:uncharacterized protein DFA_07147 [Cavenderia fasciculata]EGG20031.1 hypothetical protein DFA_07147 [Cavenderia fasciculata]|eukprot:XP_004367014.1 hypothetical protein DFA_07147 [Cavenderia fasciculata]
MTFIKGAVYDPERARDSVLQTKEHLENIEGALKESDALNKEKAKDLFEQYQKLPITFQINWSLANEDPSENQKKADFCRDKLNELNHEFRFTQSKIPRAFNADNY